MVASVEFSEETRDRTHNLDLNNEDHQAILEDLFYNGSNKLVGKNTNFYRK